MAIMDTPSTASAIDHDRNAGENLREALAVVPPGARRALPSQEIHRGPISSRLGKIAAELDTAERALADLRKAIEDIKGLL